MKVYVYKSNDIENVDNTHDYLVNVLENLGQADALLLRDVLLVRDVITVIFSTSSSAATQALLAPRLL